MTVWEIAQKGEREWWFDGVHDNARAYEEQEKQKVYAEKMGLALLPDGTYDLGGKSVLDIGGGPVSLLLKCKNLDGARVLDPMDIPEWVKARYAEHDIMYERIKGEEVGNGGVLLAFDEVWLYNALLHTEDPQKVIERAKAAGKVIRIFEWLNTTKNDMHPHTFTKEQLDEWLGCNGDVEDIGYGNGYVTKSYSAVVNNGHSVESVAPGIRHKRFHLLGLPHVATNKSEALACAFSQKVIKMAKMLKSMGHTVFFYGVEGSDVECDEYIQVTTQELLHEVYGDYDMRKETYKHNPNDLAYRTFNAKTIPEIQKRMDGNDYLLIPFAPLGYKHIIDALQTDYIDSKDKLHLVVEMGIGYRGTYCKYRVFESVSQMHYNYGLEGQMDGSWYDAVIPNYFDPDDFAYSSEKDDYFLYLGRVVIRKGIDVAVQATGAIGARLIVAGQMAGENVDLSADHVEYVGFADLEKRKELLSRAKALFLPTQYIEPFGGVIIEAMMSGTPVITTDWGAFPELVDHGITGYRCRTLDQFVWAAKNIGEIDSAICRDYALENFSLDRVKLIYEEYFDMLLDVKENQNGKGWGHINSNRADLDWLRKHR